MNLKIEQVLEENDYVVQLAGEIDVYTADKLNKAILPLTEDKVNNVKVDLQNVTYMDSTGLGVFIAAYKSAKKHESNLSLINTQQGVLRLFKITGLDEIIDVRGMDKVSETNG